MPINKKIIKDFERMIRSQRHKIINERVENKKDEVFLNGATKMLEVVIDELVTIFKNDNDKFDADKFYSACEIEKE